MDKLIECKNKIQYEIDKLEKDINRYMGILEGKEEMLLDRKHYRDCAKNRAMQLVGMINALNIVKEFENK